jgi:hypothetical protein
VKNRTQLILEGLRPEFLPADQPGADANGGVPVFAQ